MLFRSFVSDLHRNSDEAAVVGAIVLLGKSLGKVVIAEGIETSEQLNQLRQMGCSTGQGFHLSRPLSPELVEKLLDGLATRAYSAVAPQAFERVPLFH